MSGIAVVAGDEMELGVTVERCMIVAEAARIEARTLRADAKRWYAKKREEGEGQSPVLCEGCEHAGGRARLVGSVAERLGRGV